MIEHTFVDVELPPDPGRQDDEIRMTLDKMGGDEWELVSVLPAVVDEQDQAITALRLFFKRTDNITPIIDQAVFERSRATIPLRRRHAAVAIYCPPSWNGVGFRLVYSGDNLDVFAIMRESEHGSVCAAVWPSISLAKSDLNKNPTASVIVREWPRPISNSDLRSLDLPTFGEPKLGDVPLFDGATAEVDWRHRSAFPDPL